MSYEPRHRPRATSFDAVLPERRRQRPSPWLLALAAAGVAAALANAFPAPIADAWQRLRGWAHPEASTEPATPDNTGSVAQPPVATPVTAAPQPPLTTPQTRPFDPDAPMTVIRALPPPQPPRAQTTPVAATPAAAPRRASPEEGMVAALRTGVVRPGTEYELAEWKARNGRAGKRFDERARGMPVYVITGDFTIPDGLAGANAVIFILPRGAPYPHGDPGHSPILDMRTGACMGGMNCAFIRED